MHHLRARRRLNRTSEHRKAMLRNMAASLFEHGTISTTIQKAKEVQRFAEKLITKAKRANSACPTSGHFHAEQSVDLCRGRRQECPQRYGHRQAVQ